MKIQLNEDGEQLTLEIEGKLAGAFVAALEDCWHNAQSSQAGRRICVDLKNVTCVDRAGTQPPSIDAPKRSFIPPGRAGRSRHSRGD
jgi:hypothetical protein